MLNSRRDVCALLYTERDLGMDRRGKFCEEKKRPEHPERAVVAVGSGQCPRLAPPTGLSLIAKRGRRPRAGLGMYVCLRSASKARASFM